MQLARVVGTVVCTRKVPAWSGQRLKLVQPVRQSGEPTGRPLVALDVVSSDTGSLVFFVRGREAAQAIEDPTNPADAAIVALVDRIEGPGPAPA